jgi:hypothetical protein
MSAFLALSLSDDTIPNLAKNTHISMMYKTAKVKPTHFVHNSLKSLSFFLRVKKNTWLENIKITSYVLLVPTFNEHELEHTDIERQSPQPRDYMSILTDAYNFTN